MGSRASHAFYDAIYVQNALLFYCLIKLPVFYLPMGNFYDLIGISGYFITLVVIMSYIVRLRKIDFSKYRVRIDSRGSIEYIRLRYEQIYPVFFHAYGILHHLSLDLIGNANSNQLG